MRPAGVLFVKRARPVIFAVLLGSQLAACGGSTPSEHAPVESNDRVQAPSFEPDLKAADPQILADNVAKSAAAAAEDAERNLSRQVTEKTRRVRTNDHR